MKYRLSVGKNKVADFYEAKEIDSRIAASGGIVGPQGPIGPNGPQGEQGIQGIPGTSGEPVITAGTTSQYWRGDKSWQTHDKASVGLSNVDNTTDALKPVSTAQQTALNLKSNSASPSFTGNVGVGSTTAVVPLDVTGANGPLLSIRSDFTAIGKNAMIRFGDQSQTVNYQKGAIIYEGVAGSARGRIHIALENTDASTSVVLADAKLTVLSNGNVGIGTTGPTSKLQVVGIPIFATNATAITGGLTAGAFYRTGTDPDHLCIVH